MKQTEPLDVLLLSTVGQSGSNFLGRLLHSQPGSFYLYGPLQKIQEWNLLTQKTAIQSLKAIFTCNIKGLILKSIQNAPNPVIKHNNLTSCRNREATECLSFEELNKACRSHPTKIVKTIGTKVSWLLPLFDDPDINLRVIHLVRDPRGSLTSSWKVGWNYTAENSCRNIRDDLNSGGSFFRQYPEQ